MNGSASLRHGVRHYATGVHHYATGVHHYATGVRHCATSSCHCATSSRHCATSSCHCATSSRRRPRRWMRWRANPFLWSDIGGIISAPFPVFVYDADSNSVRASSAPTLPTHRQASPAARADAGGGPRTNARNDLGDPPVP